jgi:tetratricopeptide (TPR) repeat protein
MFSRSALALAATLALGACNSLLDTNPPDQLSDDKTIKTPAGARAALAGAYSALQSGFYYGGTFTHFGDLYADNAVHTGTFTSYQDAGNHAFQADNSDVTGLWNAVYDAIKRDNTILARVPAVTGFQAGEQDQILGEAYFLRALNYHNLVKLFGGVPLILAPVTDPNQAGGAIRSSAAEVYTQVLADLAQAESRMTNATTPKNHATLAAAKALAARVYLFQGNYAQALVKAEEVVALGYSLAPNYPDLFNNDLVDTPEDLFTLSFTATQPNLLGYYWLSYDLGGRFEIAPSLALMNAYDTTSADLRFTWNIAPDPTVGFQEQSAYGTKWRTVTGGEDFHVIRFAEILFMKAEAFARNNQLDSAVANYNPILARAGLDTDTLGVDITTQQQVLDRIDQQRRLEFFAEGDRWSDMVRTGRAQGILGIPAFRELWPIPQAEITVAPGVVQNPGY